MTLGKEEVNFLNVPTPLERLDNLSRELNLNLYIKRDDLTNYGGGGNKLRKLEYFVKDALDKNATVLMTVGGAQTNHGRLTATVAAKYGLKSIILSADTYPGEISSNLLLDGILGCHVYLSKTGTDGRYTRMPRHASICRNSGRLPRVPRRVGRCFVHCLPDERVPAPRIWAVSL